MRPVALSYSPIRVYRISINLRSASGPEYYLKVELENGYVKSGEYFRAPGARRQHIF